jgi:hypothetical protein
MEQRFEQRAFRAAVRPREHIKKIKCLITPGSGDCAPQQQQQPPKKRNKDLFGNVK